VINGDYAVTHYVAAGIDAPPLTDRFPRNGTPDYPEAVAAAADLALSYYYEAPDARPNRPFPPFRPPPCDRAGPDRRPDIYIKRSSSYGRAISQVQAAGGAFVLISNRLERPKGRNFGQRFGIALWTTAHEVFHLIQYSYVRQGMPRWVAEGTAQTLALQVPLNDDIALRTLFFEVERRWWKQPTRPWYDESLYCERCYGGSTFWGDMLFQRQARDELDGVRNTGDPTFTATFLQQYFEALEEAGTRISPYGLREFYPVFREEFFRFAKTLPIDYDPAVYLDWPTEHFVNRVFSDFCMSAYWERGMSASPLAKQLLVVSESGAATQTTLNPFSCRYFRVAKPPADVKAVLFGWRMNDVENRMQPIVTVAWGGIPTRTGGFDFQLDDTYRSSDRSAVTGSLNDVMAVELDSERTRNGEMIIAVGSGLRTPIKLALAWIPQR